MMRIARLSAAPVPGMLSLAAAFLICAEPAAEFLAYEAHIIYK
jgi:hypothetical protein